ncbi:hypothetical protein AB0D84_14340 [Streptomyces sp. NPDC048193]|uniref:hypothetical protein n=1 Tax=unclassified Streptomyces TaxID=2593676 RepID=UPI003434DCBA
MEHGVDELGQALVELVDLRGELSDALGEHAQRAEQLGVAEAGQLFPQDGVGYDQDGLELV